MANYHGLLEAVDCHINSVRCDMAVNRGAGGIPEWHISFFTIGINLYETLEAVDYDIHSAGYDMVLELCWRPSQF
eukprot:scaffold4296_cov72-Skeletonema_dohrnii-CCMP3373.AAC.7